MGKDKRNNRKGCARCENWAEEGSELCWECEQDVLNEIEPEYSDPLDQERADSMVGGE